MLGPSLSYGFVPQPCNKCFSFSECPLFSFLLLIAFCIAPKLIITITNSFIIVSCSFFSVSIDISSQFSSFPSLAYSYFFSKFVCPQSKPAKLLSFLQFVFLSLSSHDTCLFVQLLLLISDRLHHRLHRPLKKQQKEELLLLSVCCRTLLLPFPFFPCRHLLWQQMCVCLQHWRGDYVDSPLQCCLLFLLHLSPLTCSHSLWQHFTTVIHSDCTAVSCVLWSVRTTSVRW